MAIAGTKSVYVNKYFILETSAKARYATVIALVICVLPDLFDPPVPDVI